MCAEGEDDDRLLGLPEEDLYAVVKAVVDGWEGRDCVVHGEMVLYCTVTAEFGTICFAHGGGASSNDSSSQHAAQRVPSFQHSIAAKQWNSLRKAGRLMPRVGILRLSFGQENKLLPMLLALRRYSV